MAPPIKVEYAKSARSRCTLKACNLFIEKGELRIGTGSLMPGADELSYKWRHLCCFTGRQIKNMGASVDNIEGFEDVEEAHQSLIHKMLKGQLEGDASVKGAIISAVIAGASEGDGKKKAAKKKAGVGALLMGNSNADLSQLQSQLPSSQTATAAATGTKRPRTATVTRATVTTLDGRLVDCGRGGGGVEGGAESDTTDDFEVGVTTQKAPCPHGAECFYKSPAHFERFSHAGDAEVARTLPNGRREPTVIRRIERVKNTTNNLAATCTNNTNTTNSVPATYAVSPAKPKQQQPQSGGGAFLGTVTTNAAVAKERPPCPYGNACVLRTAAHMQQYNHHLGESGGGGGGAAPPATLAPAPVAQFGQQRVIGGGAGAGLFAPATAAVTANPNVLGAVRPPCPYLPMCLRTDAKHLADFSHH